MPSSRTPTDDRSGHRPPGFGPRGTRLLELAENVVYGLIAVLLVGAALVLLVLAGRTGLSLLTHLDQTAAIELLDVLLLVFIVVELLFAVRSTVEKRELVAEPFLLVGVLASIKEIVVLSVEAAGAVGQPGFGDRMVEVGVLGGLVLLFGLTAWLLRRKEREPDEGRGSATPRAHGSA